MDRLPSWNERPRKAAIVNYVAAVTAVTAVTGTDWATVFPA